MRSLWFVAILVSALSAAQAAELPEPKAVLPRHAKAVAEIASYGMGRDTANTLRAQGVEINVEQFILGL